MVELKKPVETGASDPVVQRLAQEDPVSWFKKPNLRYLYFMLFPTCMGIEITSGFDSQMINALQIVPAWQECEYACRPMSDCTKGRLDVDSISDFDHPTGSLNGIIAAAYSLGAILSLYFIPMVNDRWGRRWSIAGGSAVMVIGAIVQCLSVHGKYG